MMIKNRDDFSPKTKQKLAERAGYICSSPDCNSITIGPSEKLVGSSANIGHASHICGASEGGPRYNNFQTPAERSSIENGIWLCARCAGIIDKNNGTDYPANILNAWKASHERMISQLLKSGTSPLSLTRKNTSEGLLVQEIVDFLDTKGALFIDPVYERNDFVIRSLGEIRTNLIGAIQRIDTESTLRPRIQKVVEYCRTYMNEMSNQSDFDFMVMNLAVMRKGIGVILKVICEQYGIKPTQNLIGIMPSY